jgi:YidC/Oxa1 family membrane protein insertase
MESNSNIFDRRTLLAFVLMFVVWFIWVTVFPQRPKEELPAAGEPIAELDATSPGAGFREPEPQSSPPVVTDESASDRTTESPADTADGWATLEASGRGEPIKISTPHFEALIDPVGADVLEWKLKNYDLIDGRPVNLINDRTTDLGSQYAHALSVQLEDRALDLRRVVFEADRSEIVLNEGDEPQTLGLVAERGDGGQLRLELTFDPERFGFDVEARFRGTISDAMPMAMEISWPGGIAGSEPDSALEYREFRAVARVGEDVHKVKFTNLMKGGAKGHSTAEGTVSWGGVQSKYFLAAVLDPDPKRGFVRLSGDNNLGVQTFQTNLALSGKAPAVTKYSVYIGPSDFDELSYYDDEPFNAHFTSLIDLGWGPIRPVASVTMTALRLMHKVIPNWGWTIILFSILTKMLFWPLTRSSTQSMKRMQEIQPELQSLKERHKNDQQKQSQEMMRIYKENKVNPVGGCLPMVVQMPVFFALFQILRKTIDLRQADFMFWITDLSRPDVIFAMPFDLPFLGHNVSLLPFLMALAMWAQTKISAQTTAAPAGAGGGNMMAQQMKMMNTMMPLMMFFIFYKSPSGLVLYWLVNTILTAAQTWRVHQKSTPAPVQEPLAGEPVVSDRASKTEKKK